jgi:hypothetical protein
MFGQYSSEGGRRLRVQDVRAPGAKVRGAGHNRFVLSYPWGEQRFRLYQTDVVTVLSDGTVILDDGGFPTRTTRRAMADGIKALLGADVLVWSNGHGGHVVCQASSYQTVADFKGRAVYAPGHFAFAPEEPLLPLCAEVMGCLCAGHARSLHAALPCDARE